MAKLFGSAKAAFLRLMAKGRRKHRKGKGAKARARKARRAHGRKRKHTRSRARSRRRGKRRSNPGVEALLVNPTGGRKMARKRSHARKSNPHRKHRRRHARRHRNPGGMLKGLPGQALKIGVPAIVAGAAAGFVESKFLGAKSPMVRGLARVAMGLGAAALLRKNPMRAAVAAGAIIGGIGNEAGIRMGGGLVLTSKTAGMKELAEAMSADDEMGLVFKEEMRGLGTVVEMQALSDDGGEVGDADVDGISEDEAA